MPCILVNSQVWHLYTMFMAFSGNQKDLIHLYRTIHVPRNFLNHAGANFPFPSSHLHTWCAGDETAMMCTRGSQVGLVEDVETRSIFRMHASKMEDFVEPTMLELLRITESGVPSDINLMTKSGPRCATGRVNSMESKVCE